MAASELRQVITIVPPSPQEGYSVSFPVQTEQHQKTTSDAQLLEIFMARVQISVLSRHSNIWKINSLAMISIPKFCPTRPVAGEERRFVQAEDNCDLP